MSAEEFTKKYYKIREVSEMLSLPASTIRFWEATFPSVIRPRRNEHGIRFFTPRDIEALQLVQYLLHDKGLKIDAAREQLQRNHRGVSRRAQTLEKLKGVRDELQQMLDALNRMR